MKKYQKIICTLFMALSATGLSAQKLDAYNLVLPDTVFVGGGTIYVDSFTTTSTDPTELAFADQFRKAYMFSLQVKNHGELKAVSILNPWQTTCIYKVTENKAEADYIIGGQYNYIAKSEKSFTEDSLKDKRSDVPVVYYRFTASSSAALVGDITVTSAKNGNHLRYFSYSESKNESKTLIMEQPTVSEPTSFYSDLNNRVVNSNTYNLSPRLVVVEYDFPKCKPDNKDLKKEFNDKFKELKDLADAGKVREMAAIYRALQQKEDSQDIHECIGLCYEIIGNYTKAKEEYEKSGNNKRISAINEQIRVRDILVSLGVKVEEGEL
ncbi:MAG: hypothetical protein CVU11_07430 [Bacteroidetes bacterium HGW-Bacteroidetes-6]|jgi:hypothetical protein|nr:MAG: hypothetical protein CVU11_07430 [Bacteroidetes bacterium HGW-Bacteroidetes-6]